MLKGIPLIIPPELLMHLSSMGHGDCLVIGDCHFPTTSLCKRCVRMDGSDLKSILDAILTLFPVDVKEAIEPVTLMKSTDYPNQIQPVWEVVEKCLKRANYDGEICRKLERFDFYNEAKQAYVGIQSGEKLGFGCVILRKGVIHD